MCIQCKMFIARFHLSCQCNWHELLVSNIWVDTSLLKYRFIGNKKTTIWNICVVSTRFFVLKASLLTQIQWLGRKFKFLSSWNENMVFLVTISISPCKHKNWIKKSQGLNNESAKKHFTFLTQVQLMIFFSWLGWRVAFIGHSYEPFLWLANGKYDFLALLNCLENCLLHMKRGQLSIYFISL